MREWKLQERTAGLEIAGVEEAGVDSSGGKCRSVIIQELKHMKSRPYRNL